MTAPAAGAALIVEDDLSLARLITMALTDRGLTTAHEPDGAAGAVRLAAGRWDLVLLDLNLPTLPGLEVLARLPRTGPRPAVIVMTADGAVETAVEAMRRGADDFLVKGPDFLPALEVRVDRVLAQRRLAAENLALKAQLRAHTGSPALIGDAPAFRAAVAMLVQAADAEATVLITGESGTGKELAARLVHARSRRADGPFIVVNCAAIPEALLESELFGHVRGAFTGATGDHEGKFEQAAGGTLFFDEIGEMKPAMQAKLLRAIQEREIERIGSGTPRPVDIRLVAATNADLKSAVAAGRFREDLYYRLNVVAVTLPPLRDRPEDLPALVAHGLRRLGRPDAALAPAALEAFRRHRWPGNVRELEHALERAMVLLGGGTTITPDLLPDELRGAALPAAAGPLSLPPGGVDLEMLEKDLLAQALARTGGNQTKAAALLGLTRATLIYRMEKYGLKSP